MPEMIEFYLNDQLIRTQEPPASALLDFVRYHEHLTGTKTAEKLTDELAASRATTGRLRDDIAVAVAALPPDPRGGAVEVRAGRFVSRANALGYELVLTRERLGAKPLEGVVQLVVGGATARGVEASVTSPPAPVAIGAHAVVRGSVALPEGFKPRQAMVQVLDRAGGRPIGMRVLLVK